MKGFALYKKGFAFLRGMGIRATMRKIAQRIRTTKIFGAVRMKPYTPREIAAQRKNQLQGFGSICVVTYVFGKNTEQINALIDSLLAQTYVNWKLCLIGAEGDIISKDSRIIRADSFCLESLPSELEYLALLARGCLLHECALFEVVRSLAIDNAELVYTDEIDETGTPLYKPDYAPDTLRSTNYIGGFWATKKTHVDHSIDLERYSYDLILRITEQAEKIVHIQRALCLRTEPLAHNSEADIAALTNHLARCGFCAKIEPGRIHGLYRMHYEIEKPALVSILIPNKDHAEDLIRCITSLKEQTSFSDWEIIIIENNSTEPETFACYAKLIEDKRIRVVTWEGPFNYAAINNFGVEYAHGEYLLLLNNDVEIISSNWIEEMMMYAQRQDVGAVGAMLYFPDDTVQHAGVIVGLGGVADHAHKEYPRGAAGYMNRLAMVQNFSAVTAACMLIRRNVYHEVGGFDTAFQVAFNDVDLCMRIREAGYLITWTPYAELYHWESKSRGSDETPKRYLRFSGEVERFQKRWMSQLLIGDPYYNRNLTQKRNDFSE